jgi:hypothetical protein
MTDFAQRLEEEARFCLAARRELACGKGLGGKGRVKARRFVKVPLQKTRQRADLSFCRLLAMLEPRIARLTHNYRLTDMADDAAQVCAIALHRALDSYEPDKARFTTHVTWQMRGELQSLRHRMRLDSRQGARKAGVRSISLENMMPESPELQDARSHQRTESGLSAFMAGRYLDRLLDRSGQPREERALIRAHVFDRDVPAAFAQRTAEQRRQIIRRNMKHCSKAAEI